MKPKKRHNFCVFFTADETILIFLIDLVYITNLPYPCGREVFHKVTQIPPPEYNKQDGA